MNDAVKKVKDRALAFAEEKGMKQKAIDFGDKAVQKVVGGLAERMKDFGSGAPVVFVGDHNSNETEPAAKSLSKVLANALYQGEKAPAGAWALPRTA